MTQPCCGARTDLPYKPVGCPKCNPEFWATRSEALMPTRSQARRFAEAVLDAEGYLQPLRWEAGLRVAAPVERIHDHAAGSTTDTLVFRDKSSLTLRRVPGPYGSAADRRQWKADAK